MSAGDFGPVHPDAGHFFDIVDGGQYGHVGIPLAAAWAADFAEFLQRTGCHQVGMSPCLVHQRGGAGDDGDRVSRRLAKAQPDNLVHAPGMALIADIVAIDAPGLAHLPLAADAAFHHHILAQILERSLAYKTFFFHIIMMFKAIKEANYPISRFLHRLLYFRVSTIINKRPDGGYQIILLPWNRSKELDIHVISILYQFLYKLIHIIQRIE